MHSKGGGKQMSVIDELITDRTEGDLYYGNPKGKYDYVDYNRLGRAINYVANEARNAGISMEDISAKTDYTVSIENSPRVGDIQTIFAYLAKIKEVTGLQNELATAVDDLLTINGANAVEKLLKDADAVLSTAHANAPYSSMIYSGMAATQI